MYSLIMPISKQGIVKIHLFLNYDSSYLNNENFVAHLLKDLRGDKKIGYAGFKNKKYLSDYLLGEIFFKKEKNKIVKFNINESEIVKNIKESLNLCYKQIPFKELSIFIFPSFHSFIKEKMSGVTGFTSWQDIILLFLNPVTHWQNALRETVAHEFSHIAMLKNNQWETLLDSLIFEGLAEHFREQTVGGKVAPWSKAISLKEAEIIYTGVKKKLNSKNFKLYQSLFWGDKKYPLWSGYSLGYYIIKSFLKNNLKLSWPEIIKLKPQEILGKSDFGK